MTDPPFSRARLDHALVARGLVPTRARARGLILRGRVRLNDEPERRPAAMVAPADTIVLDPLDDGGDYVSFGADKLLAALNGPAHDFPIQGGTFIDIGASTGGFTEVLLRRGAARVHAIDVGTGQLHPRLREDPRVVSREGTDARDVTSELIGATVDGIVADVSFISLTQALGPALRLARPGAWLVALVKPQFEAGRAHVGGGGIVRDATARAAVVKAVAGWIGAHAGWLVVGEIEAPRAGARANAEYLIAARHSGGG